MRRDFEGGVYWDEMAVGAATFRGQRDFEVRRDFEEIRYIARISRIETIII